MAAQARLKDHGSDIEIEADVIAEGLGLSVIELQTEMREGRVISRCERGMGEDLGRVRLTFSFGRRQFQVIADDTGTFIKSSKINFGAQSTS
jgi:hypothetical protein